jgi:deoxyhypusine synthase
LSKFLHKPATPFKIDKSANVADLINAMKNISFPDCTLAQCFATWKKMLREDSLIFLGLSGALVQKAVELVIDRQKPKFELGKKPELSF